MLRQMPRLFKEEGLQQEGEDREEEGGAGLEQSGEGAWGWQL